jgi:hypothetical protein
MKMGNIVRKSDIGACKSIITHPSITSEGEFEDEAPPPYASCEEHESAKNRSELSFNSTSTCTKSSTDQPSTISFQLSECSIQSMCPDVQKGSTISESRKSTKNPPHVKSPEEDMMAKSASINSCQKEVDHLSLVFGGKKLKTEIKYGDRLMSNFAKPYQNSAVSESLGIMPGESGYLSDFVSDGRSCLDQPGPTWTSLDQHGCLVTLHMTLWKR